MPGQAERSSIEKFSKVDRANAFYLCLVVTFRYRSIKRVEAVFPFGCWAEDEPAFKACLNVPEVVNNPLLTPLGKKVVLQLLDRGKGQWKKAGAKPPSVWALTGCRGTTGTAWRARPVGLIPRWV